MHALHPYRAIHPWYPWAVLYPSAARPTQVRSEPRILSGSGHYWMNLKHIAIVASLWGLQTFVKTVNYQHMMPTRYTLDVDLKNVVTAEALETATKKEDARKVRY